MGDRDTRLGVAVTPRLRLRSGPVTLRPFRVGDFTADYVRWLNSTRVNRYLRRQHWSRQEAFIWLCDVDADPYALIFAIYANGRMIGTLKLERDQSGSFVYLGLMLGRDRGKGYGTHAIRAASRWALRLPGVIEVRAGIEAANLASMAAFRKAGFTVPKPAPVTAVLARRAE